MHLPQANLTITKSAPVVATVGTNFAYSFNIANGGTGLQQERLL
jgi:hypothetical protein